ncbi:hypothetical protein ACFFKU_06785 [Kineococcus gynurae]|uniref:Uncharacterized protein n=1 Tax=Kineococcus gynurae TaxID=452979 RepID=A0ABV5LX00_9ACTN
MTRRRAQEGPDREVSPYRPRTARIAAASPYQLVLLAMTFLAGLVILIGVDLPPSIGGNLPHALGWAWAGALITGALAGTVGLADRLTYRGLLVESAGCSIHGGACAFYVVALVLGNGAATVVVPASLITGIAIASTWRAMQARREARDLLRTVLPLLRTTRAPEGGEGHDRSNHSPDEHHRDRPGSRHDDGA